MQLKERNAQIDIAKGIGILLVVMLHASLPSIFGQIILEHFIWQFYILLGFLL